MTRWIRFTLGIVTFLGSLNAWAGRIDQVTQQMNSIFQCPERVWPGLKKDSYRILFAQPSTAQIWLWTAKTGQTEIVPSTDLPLAPDLPSYAFVDFRGQRAVIINLDVTKPDPRVASIPVDGAVALAFHEGFHYLFQMKEPWVAQFTTAERKTDLDRVAALYPRQMLIRALKSALLRGEGFGPSAHWLKKWEASGEAPETKFSDVLEGTAHYAELIASIFAVRGCGILEPAVMELALGALSELVKEQESLIVRRELFKKYAESGYQIESYDIGLLTLLALRRQGFLVGANEFAMGRDFVAELQAATQSEDKLRVYNEMVAAVTAVRTPADLLLRDVVPVDAADDPTLRELIRQSAQ